MKGIPDKGQNGFDFALILSDIPMHLFITDFNVFVCKIRPILRRPTRKTLSKNLLFYFGFPKKNLLLSTWKCHEEPRVSVKNGSIHSNFFNALQELCYSM